MSELRDKVEVQVTATTGGLAAGMAQAQATVAESTAAMQAVVSGISSKFQGVAAAGQQAASGVSTAVNAVAQQAAGVQAIVGKVSGGFAMMAGVLAGGAIFKEVVSATKEWNGEAMKMAAQLGITTEQASVLNVAIGDIYSSTDDYLKAAAMMTRQINSGGEGFKKLGVDIKDANGHLRPTGDIMQDVLGKLNGLQQGTDRNAAGMAIFGKGWGEASKLLKLNAEVMEEAKKKADALNLVVGGDAVQAQKDYKAAMNDVDDAMLGMKLALGQQLMPVLADMGKFIAEVGTPVVQGLGWAFKVVMQALDVVVFGVKAFANMIGASFGAVMDVTEKLANMFSNLLAGNWKAAANDAKGAAMAIKNNFSAAFDGIAADWEKLGEKAMKRWDGPASKETRVGQQGEGQYDPDKGKDTSEETLRAFKAELEKKKSLEENWFTWSVSRELEFWQGKLGTLQEGTKAYTAVLGEVNKLRKERQKEEHESQVEGLKAQMDELKNDGLKRLAVQDEIIKEEVRLHGAGSKEVIAARRERGKIVREIQAEERALQLQEANFQRDYALQMVDADTEALAYKRDMGEISAQQEIDALITLEQRKLEIKKLAIQAALQDETLSQTARQDLLNQQFLLEKATQDKIVALRHQSSVKSAADLQTFLQPLRDSMTSAISSMLAGTMTLSQGFKRILMDMGNYMNQVIAKMVVGWITGEKAKTAGTEVGVMQRIASETWGAMKSVALAIWTGLKWIAIKGYEAAAGAYSAIASIPYVGPFLAPVVAAGVLAAVVGMASNIASAAGGYDIPSGVNPLVQTHENEMILPAKHAETIRRMGDKLEQGGDFGGGGFSPTIQISAVDARGVERLFRDHQGPLLKSLRDAHRNGRG